MSQHEQKHCPRCAQAFECKPGNITQCQCYGVKLTDQERSYIEQRYKDCLCRSCLIQLKDQVALFREKFIRPSR